MRHYSQYTRNALRIVEAHQPGFRQRINGNDRCAVCFRLLQCGEYARVVGSRILPEDHDHFRLVEVIERQLSLYRCPSELAQGGAAAFVAHIAAIGQVVCPKFPDKKLVQKCSLVARPARGVKNGFVR